MKVKLTTVISSQPKTFIKIHKYLKGRRNEMEKLLNSQVWGLKSPLCSNGQWYLENLKTERSVQCLEKSPTLLTSWYCPLKPIAAS